MGEGLDGQTALITGAGSGIGRAIALALAAHGTSLLLVDKNGEGIREVSSLAEDQGVRADAYTVDLVDANAIEALCSAIHDNGAGLNILVNAAGIMCVDRIEDARVEDFHLQFGVNVLAPFILTKRLLPLLRSTKGQVVFVNSSIVQNPSSATAQYSATKHALRGFADALRQEVNPDGIRVLSVYPGRTATPMQEQLYRLEKREYRPERLLQPGDVAEAVLSALRLSRSAEATDVHIRPLIKS